jgi:hypothetical protein
MALAFTLIERTPHGLAWLVTAPGGVGTGACDTGTIRNRSDATDPEGLRTNSSAGTAIGRLARRATVDQAAARRRMNGQGLTGAGTSLRQGAADVRIERGRVRWRSARGACSLDDWSADPNEGAAAGDAASAGFPVIQVQGPNNVGAAAVLEWQFADSRDR